MGEAAAPRRGQPGGRDSRGLAEYRRPLGMRYSGLYGNEPQGIQKAVAGNRWGVRDNFNARCFEFDSGGNMQASPNLIDLRHGDLDGRWGLSYGTQANTAPGTVPGESFNVLLGIGLSAHRVSPGGVSNLGNPTTHRGNILAQVPPACSGILGTPS